jgi:hypothetical protein
MPKWSGESHTAEGASVGSDYPVPVMAAGDTALPTLFSCSARRNKGRFAR